jgi:hypothetical protein
MATSLLLYVVDIDNMRESYKEIYTNQPEFLQAFRDACNKYEDIHDNAIHVMRDWTGNIEERIIWQFINGLFAPSGALAHDENGYRLDGFWPATISEDDILMLERITEDYHFDKLNDDGYPSTKRQDLLEWLRIHIGKEVHITS